MAHQIENMAYVGQTPWHGLGNQLSPNQPIEVWAQQAGMDWRIESSDVSYMAKNDRGQSIIMPYEEQRVLYRSDTHAPLSVVSQRYQEVQPMEILEFYRDLTEQSNLVLCGTLTTPALELCPRKAMAKVLLHTTRILVNCAVVAKVPSHAVANRI